MKEQKMDPDWLKFHPNPKIPDFKLPEGAVDAHCHVFGPSPEFPFAPERKYTPCNAGKDQLYALRDQTPLPVVGIQQAAVMTALTLGQRFGVIAILPNSIPRHMRAFGAMGALGRLAGDRALGLTVADLADERVSLEAMIATGCKLRDGDGADVLIMGCAGMARYREALETATGLPVVEPCQAAVSMALGQIALKLAHKKEETHHA